MTWLLNQIKKWKNKSSWSKITDVLFLLVILFMIVPEGRMMYRRAILYTGLFNMTTEFYEEGKSIGEAEDNLTFVSRDGKTHRLSDFAGKVVFLNFWATWCPPCRAEFPPIIELIEKFGKHPDVAFILLTGENFDTADNFIEKQKTESYLPVYQQTSNYSGLIFGGSLPTTVVIDKHGEIAFLKAGMADYSSKDFIESFENLLK